ncbi:hypothetical protein [Herbaspirillum sp.]|nr:hypothetical protein [Herbaspirillum sp.]|tara:strand:- start:445 stop:591 length:147 start_codon:yes stop_codon:yes gene_type:complete
MYAYTIFHNGNKVGTEFGASAQHAISRYAEGSIFPADELTAKRGVSLA